MNPVKKQTHDQLSKLKKSSEPTTRELVYLASSCCETIRGALRVGKDVLEDLRNQKVALKELPSSDDIELYYIGLQFLFNDDMFTEDEDGRHPCWPAVQRFMQSEPEFARHAINLYESMREELLKFQANNPEFGEQLLDAIDDKDETFVLKYLSNEKQSNGHSQNLANEQGEEGQLDKNLKLLEKLIRNSYVKQEDKDDIWGYIGIIVDSLLSKEEILEEIQG